MSGTCGWMDCDRPRAAGSVFCARHEAEAEDLRGKWIVPQAVKATIVVFAALAIYWAVMMSCKVRETRKELERIEGATVMALQTHGVDPSDRELLRVLREERSVRNRRATRNTLPPLDGMGVRE